MSTFTIPTIYTAVDKFSAPVKAMERANASFGNKLDVVSAKSERMFRKLTPGLSDATKQMAQMAGSAALVGAAIGTAAFSTKAIMDYENAIQKFRTIVSDLSNQDFSKFQKAINNVATETKKSSIDVAQSFEKIAGLNSKFAETSEGLSAVSKAAITLSKASGDELGVSAENLVGIMNQFSFGAMEAERTINVLAAGQAVGAASITQTAEAFTMFGSVAASANVSLEQSVGLVETLGKFSVFGSEAGTQLKGTLVQLQKAGFGYKSGLFNINDALEEAKFKFDKLKTAKEKDAFVTKTFGLINLGTGKILLNNLDTYKEYTKSVMDNHKALGRLGEAEIAANINSNTLSNKLDELKNRWINMLTSSDKASKGLNVAKKIIGLLTDNLETIITVGVGFLGFMAAWKIANIVLKGAMIASRAVATAFYIYDMVKYVASTQGITMATAAWSIAQESLNATMAANPIGALIIALGALALAVYGVNKAIEIFDEPLNKAFERKEQLRQEAFSVIELRDSYLELGKTLKDAERMAIGKAAIGVQSSIIAAKMQLASVDPEERQKGVEAIASIGNRASQLKNFMNGGFQKDYGQKFANSMDTKSFVGGIGTSQEVGQYDWINPKQAQSQATANAMTNNIVVNNALPGTTVESNGKVVSTQSANSISPKITSTMNAK